MKKRIVALLLIGCMCFSTAGCGNSKTQDNTEQPVTEIATVENTESTEVVEDDGNLLENGDFSKGTAGWGVYTAEGGASTLSVENGAGLLLITSNGSLDYSNQLYYDGFSLKKGGVYELSYKMASSHARKFEIRIQLNGGDYHAYMEETVDLTEEMQTYTQRFTMEEETDLAPRLCFNLGTAEGFEDQVHRIDLDDVTLKLVDDSNVDESVVTNGEININVNQVGYRPDDKKLAIVKNCNAGDVFEVRNSAGDVVFEGKLSEKKHSEAAAEEVCEADFTDVKEEGTYKITCGDNESYEFAVAKTVYDELLVDVVRMMYLQRCGMELDESMAENFAHPACHTQDAVIYGTDEKKDVSGGWHDAGDYGKYVVTGAQTAIDLLLCYEDNQEKWNRDDLNIPESGNGIPDIIDEVRYELDWLLKMQDESTGGVWHKVSTYSFPAFIMPQEDKSELVLSPISTTATGDFAAIMAKASVVYGDYDKEFSRKCKKAAELAWNYLEKTDGGKGFKNPVGISTGEYPDESDMDERYWASVELFKATGDKKYLDYANKQIKEAVLTGYGWIEMGSYGDIAYLSMKASDQDKECVSLIEKEIVSQADTFLENAKEDGYGCCLSLEGYNWGSNLGVCNNARTMIMASQISGDDKYQKNAKEQLDYLLGKNAMSYSFVTGYGTNAPNDVHHRPSVVNGNGKAMKAMLVGGPNRGIEDPYAANVLKDMPPAKCYADNQQSYATNEVTIYWNSPFASLLTQIVTR